MRQPQSIRLHLAAVFLLFFSLVAVLGMFSIWRLSHFNLLSADVAQVWLPTTRALGDLNNFTSDFRAIEGSNLLSSDPASTAATEKEMTDLDRTIGAAEASFEHIRHDAAVENLYRSFKQRWTGYRAIVNDMLELSRNGRKADALTIYNGSSRVAYNAASDTLGQLTDRAVADAQIASDRLGVAYRQAVWLILLVMFIAGVMVVAALIHISRSISDPLLNLADRMHRLAANDTEIDIPEVERQDEIGEMARATVVFRNNAVELMRSQRTLVHQAAVLEQQLANEQRLAQLQRNFVSMASHEFRTPMTVIDGHARRLDKVKESVRPQEIGERAGKIRSAVLRMTHLIENLLNSSRLIDAGAGVYFQPAETGCGLAAAGGLPVASGNGAERADQRTLPHGNGNDDRRLEIAVPGLQQCSLQCHQILIGGSMGGMQVLQWAASYPDCVFSAVPIAAAARHSAQNIAFHEVGRQAIMADPDWCGGRYLSLGRKPARGLAVARMAAHITYLSEAALHRKFGRNLQDRRAITYGFDADFQVESYLRHQGSTFVDRFDANSYLYITRAMDYFDLAAEYGSLPAAFTGTRSRFCVISFTSDWLFPTSESRALVHALNAVAANVSFVQIATENGHDAFLLHEPELFETLRGFLAGCAEHRGLTR